MMNPSSSPFFCRRLDAERVAAKLSSGARCTSPTGESLRLLGLGLT
jgi:hypothetical protein